MSHYVFHLSGRITRSDSGQGVRGLRVEVWSATTPALATGFGVTNRDGSYHIDLPGGRYRLLRLPRSTSRCAIATAASFTMAARTGVAASRVSRSRSTSLWRRALWWHLSRPLSWERIDEPLVPVRVMQEIEDALELLHAEGIAADLASLKLAVCATPPIEGFDRVLLDAWGALQGDLDAARRYREILDALVWRCRACCTSKSPFASEVACCSRMPARPPAPSAIRPNRARPPPRGVRRRDVLAARPSSQNRRCCCCSSRRCTWHAATTPSPSAMSRCCSSSSAASKRWARCMRHRSRRCSATSRRKPTRAICSSCCAAAAARARLEVLYPAPPPGCCTPASTRRARCLREAVAAGAASVAGMSARCVRLAPVRVKRS